MKRVILYIILIGCSINGYSTHLRGGQITFRVINCQTNSYEIILTIYKNTLSQVNSEDGILNFGDGDLIKVPLLPTTVIDATNFIGQAVYKVVHTYKLTNTYRITYTEFNRNAGILNFNNSSNTAFQLESSLLADPAFCFQPLSFNIPPIDRACTGLIFTHNPGAQISSGDSLSYQLVAPLKGNGIPVDGYQYPNASSYYSSNYQQSNEAKNGLPIITINQDGTLNWDAPGKLGEYAIAIKVLQWKKLNDEWIITSFVVRDMQILVQDCQATRPYLIIPEDICISPGFNISKKIQAGNKSSDPVTIEVILVDNYYSSPPVFKNLNSIQSTRPPNDTANIRIDWKVICDQVKPQPYRVILKVSSLTQNGIRLSSFYTLNVSVIGIAPTYQSLNLSISSKSLTIHWNPYPCAEATTLQIWRRIDHDFSTESKCQIGIPRAWGFTKIGESTSQSYIDKNLNPGATYCYRLLAIYTGPNQTVSIASKDTCIGPIAIDAPVLTNVSVQSTDKASGQIIIRWTSPFEINKSLFPKPYIYRVLRTNDEVNFKDVGLITDTTFVDKQLNTSDSLYGYKIIVYSPNSIAGNNPIDTSALAFYPRLNFKPTEFGVRLIWGAKVPWSNQSSRFPRHYIYRREIGAKEYDLLDSVDVNALLLDQGYEFEDLGKNIKFPLKENYINQYKIETLGVYGNPKIKEPLRNISNEIIAQPIDKNPPCAPKLIVSTPSCDAILSGPCVLTDLKNNLSWEYPNDCGNDIDNYKVYFSSSVNSDSILLATTLQMELEDRKQNSLAGCYSVMAIDRSGNIGKVSNRICVDNCTNIYLPNVLTVNKDGFNETFPALDNVSNFREPIKCPRFVNTFSIEIFNRWGQKVYEIRNASIGKSEFEWKGLDENGNELPAGVYYYSAKVKFESLNSKGENIRGWVHLIR